MLCRKHAATNLWNPEKNRRQKIPTKGFGRVPAMGIYGMRPCHALPLPYVGKSSEHFQCVTVQQLGRPKRLERDVFHAEAACCMEDLEKRRKGGKNLRCLNIELRLFTCRYGLCGGGSWLWGCRRRSGSRRRSRHSAITSPVSKLRQA